MRALPTAIFVLAAAACSVMDDELDEINFKDGDSGPDGDSDTDGLSCSVDILGYLEMDGVCQEPSDACEGGTNPMDASGDCDVGVCCIGTDQCESYAGVLECQDASCADDGGGPFGCPGNGWCCPII